MINVFMPDLIHGSWRRSLICNALPSFILLVVSYFFVPESAYWHLVKGNVTGARKEVKYMAQMNKTWDRVEPLVRTLEADPAVIEGGKDVMPNPIAKLLGAMGNVRFFTTALCFAFLTFLG